MREIKFRAWCVRTSTMLMDVQDMYDGLGDWFDNHGKEVDPVDHCTCNTFGDFLEDGDYEVMQYTGLKDKNGKEIYEGDVVRVKTKHGVSDTYKMVITFYFSFTYNGFNITKSFIKYAETEVIGNIYENPELLQ